MSLLIQYGADVNARQENDENALHSKLAFTMVLCFCHKTNIGAQNFQNYCG